MKVLHTSDWHLGRTLYGRKRYEEFSAFLTWLAETIEAQQVDILLVSGDIFDTSAPSHRAQQLYYRFLCRVATSCCRHVIVIGGNHDSPSFLNAPQELLKALDVHVIGSSTENLGDEVLLLRDLAGAPELIVCAVPYLRDRDIRTAQAGESIEDKERKLLEGLRNHYSEVGALAEEMSNELGGEIPIIAMGHLFTAGGQTVDGDGVRELYVGSLAHVTAEIFPTWSDYVALGHLHVPQKINGSEVMRYSGSPLAMGFGEARQQKSICLIEFVQRTARVTTVDVPVFQQLERIHGTWDEIAVRIRELSLLQRPIWLEIVYDGVDVIGDLRERLEQALAATGTEVAMEILRVQNRRIIDRVLQQIDTDETLDDLDVDDVFDRCLDAHAVPQEQQRALLDAYRETIVTLEQQDAQAE
ncbi:MAG: exonuclease SbcCD subunit D C-terminal domain-containing protein [Thermodesulfobacteriota bacterium]|nr:exonuclease SbcCD subunit D C-terminal domain-containing protein [Thermodesulfobacteriota bacterium]